MHCSFFTGVSSISDKSDIPVRLATPVILSGVERRARAFSLVFEKVSSFHLAELEYGQRQQRREIHLYVKGRLPEHDE